MVHDLVASVRRYFDGPGPQEIATRALSSYFSARMCFTGSRFDGLARSSDPWRFQAADFLAVSTLSVQVPARAALHLMDDPETERLLGQIPVGASIWEQPDLLDRGSAAWRLWDRVQHEHDVGRTKTSKLLAAKRPDLVPVFDAHVNAAFGLGENYWASWQIVARSGQAEDLQSTVRSAAAAAGVGPKVSILRIIDVVVWMRQHGAAQHSAFCDDCNLDGVTALG